MNKKRVLFFAIALLLVCALALAACGGGSDDTGGDDADTTTATEDDSKAIVYANKSLDYYFWGVCQAGLKKIADEKGWSFEASDANSDPAAQFDQMVNFINKSPDAIIADPIDSEGLIAAVDQAVAAGIPVGIIDTPLTGGDVAVTVAFDNYEAGTLAGESLVKALKAKYGEEKGTIVYAIGAMSSDAWRLRREGTADVLKEYPNITLYEDPAEGDIAKTQDFVLNRLSSGETIDALHTPSDNPGMGLVSALKMEDKWFTKDDPNHVIIVTIDGEPISTKFIEEGYYDYTVSQDALAYYNIVIEMLEKYTWQGEDVPLGPYSNSDYIWENCEIVDSGSGPYVKVPAFEINPENCTDSRNWGVMAESELNMPYDMSATETS